jgi:hypothetical protein
MIRCCSLLRWSADRTQRGPSASEVTAAAAIFEAVVDGALRDAAAGAHQDEAEGEAADDAGAAAMAVREDWFARLATVGRAATAASAGLLTLRLRNTQHALLRCSAAGDPK